MNLVLSLNSSVEMLPGFYIAQYSTTFLSLSCLSLIEHRNE